MYSNEIVKIARKLKIKNFIGVFPLNQLPPPSSYRRPFCFIVNTDTANLPGKHWIAVSFAKNGIVRAFDPLGVYYPAMLCDYLARSNRRVSFNHVMYQDPTSRLCGQHCLRWLRSINTR